MSECQAFPVIPGVMINTSSAAAYMAKHPGRRRQIVKINVRHQAKLIKDVAVGVDKRWARWNVNSTPLLAVKVFGIVAVVDGWHRIWRAHLLKKKYLRAYLLTEAQAKRFCLPTRCFLPKRKKSSRTR